MANRKVLINYHTSGNTAPVAENVYQGEIAVQHKTGEELLWTKNNDGAMVPFISCAQTEAMIDSKIQAADVVYNVLSGDSHISVATASTEGKKDFTVSTLDVQSEAEFEAYSAATKIRIDSVYSAETALTAVVSALTDIVLTGITGDEIITATPINTGDSGSNAYSLTHKEAKEVALGFNKVATDKYGHVIDYSAVTTADIQALGFKTSAETGEDLAALSGSVIALSAGTLADIESFSGSVIAYVKELSAGTITDNEKLSGDVITYVNALSAGTLQLSADTHNAIAAAVEALNSETAVTADNKYLKGIGIENGIITGMTEGTLPVLASATTGTGNVVTDIAVNDHTITFAKDITVASSSDLQALSGSVIALSAGTIADIEALSGDVVEYVKVVSGNIETVINSLSAGTIADIEALSGNVITYINTVSGYAHGEIVELSGAVQANESDIDNLSAATLDLSAVTLTGVSLNNTPLEVNNHIVSVPVTTSGSGIANATESGSVADALAVKEYVQNTVSSAVNYKGATSDEPTGTPVVGDLWIADSAFTLSNGKNVEVGDFIIYGQNGWDVIEKNLDGAITGNLTQDTVTLGDGLHAARPLANGAQGTVLTIGTAGTPVWADDPELSVVSAGTGNVVSDIAVNDHEITFTKGFLAASSADLQTLSAVVIDNELATAGAVTDLKTRLNALSGGTLQLSADTHNAIAAAIADLDSSSATSDSGHYVTAITIENGKISAIGQEAIPAATPVSIVNGATGDTATAVLNGIYTGGTAGHQLTLSATNKIFSARTSESADTAAALTGNITSGQVSDIVAGIKNTKVNSATTSESADTAASADKVANALSVSGYATSESSALDSAINYDGSAAQSLTFGKTTAAGKSMSFNEGIVDVEIIDCGMY